MKKCCDLCRYLYCSDESDVSGLDCEKNKVIKITEVDKQHLLCPGFKPSILAIIKETGKIIGIAILVYVAIKAVEVLLTVLSLMILLGSI